MLDERREFYRVKIMLHGRFMRQSRTEHDCTIDEISPGDAHVRTNVAVAPGERIIAYMDQIGRIEGVVTRGEGDGFAMTVAASDRKREKLAAQLTWLINRSQLGLEEDRRHERLAPRNTATMLELEDGSRFPCSIADVSLSGMAISIRNKPEIGSKVIVSTLRGRVVRHFQEGVAIEFVSLQTRESLNAAFASNAA